MAYFIKDTGLSRRSLFLIAVMLLVALACIFLAIATENFILLLVPVIVLAAVIFLVFLFREPLIALFTCVAYSFLFVIFSREIGGSIPYGTAHEIFLILLWLSIWYNADRYDFGRLRNSFIWLILFWFGLSCLQIANPAGVSPVGWFQEMRTVAIYPLGISSAGILLLNTRKRVDYFLYLILFLSLLASLNGIKQIKIGLSPGEQRFLDDVGSVTHIISGQLRVFSFMNDAGQFGASQAQLAVIALVLAFGLKGWLKKTLLLVLAAFYFYGMLISGTRGALFALVGGLFCAIFLSKNWKALIIGGSVALLFLAMLKFTYIGNANYSIYRLRTAVDPQDASFNLRLINQARLAEYMKTRPFGGGLGSIGHWAAEYNSGTYLSTVAPDSFWVKVWAMYGIIGMIIFFGMWMFIFGKSGGMLWNMEDRTLRVKLIALIGGAFGIFLCSYGNEVMNAMPSLAIFQLSVSTVFIMCAVYQDEKKLRSNTVIIN